MAPFAGEHACSLDSTPEDADVFREETTRSGKQAAQIIAVDEDNDGRRVSVRYPEDNWSEGEARSDCRDLGGTFEPAKEDD